MKFAKLFSLPIRRWKVHDSVVPEFRKELTLELDSHGLAGIASDALVDRLVEEAYFRAAREEADGIPRHGPMEDQIEDIAVRIAALWSGKDPGDPVLETILVHHGIKVRARQ